VGRRRPATPRLRRRASGRQSSRRPSAASGAAGAARNGPQDRDPRPSTTRCRSWSRVRPQYDGRVGRWRGDRAGRRSPTTCPARSSSSGRRRGARQRQAGHDRGRPVRRPRCRLLYHPCDRSHVEARALASEDARSSSPVSRPMPLRTRGRVATRSMR
jgi:hypothetical protein